MPILVATPGAAGANSYETVVEAQAYFDARVPVAGWDNSADQAALLMMATRTIDMMLSPYRQFVPPTANRAGTAIGGYYITRPTWTGTRPASNLSKLAWPRTGMYDRNGVVIAETVIPQELKEATAELAGALGTRDSIVDSSVAVKGIKSIKAGPVDITYSDGIATTKVLPDAVLFLLVPSWLTQQVVEGMMPAMFEVVSE